MRSRADTWKQFALAVVTLWLLGCPQGDSTGPNPPFDLEPFKEHARESDCADLRNNLYLIDRSMVFWEREGRCSDNRYEQVLYGRTLDEVICYRRDNIAGRQEGCSDLSRSWMFATMVANLNAPDLGLGPDHEVEPIPL